MKRLIGLIALLIPLAVSAQENEIDGYWAKMQAVAQSIYEAGAWYKLDEAKTTLGYAIYDNGNQGFHGGLTIPLLDKKDRIKRRENATSYLSKGADLIADLETQRAKIIIIKEAIPWIERRYSELGIPAIDLVLKKKEDLAASEALERAAIRKILAHIEPYQKVKK